MDADWFNNSSLLYLRFSYVFSYAYVFILATEVKNKLEASTISFRRLYFFHKLITRTVVTLKFGQFSDDWEFCFIRFATALCISIVVGNSTFKLIRFIVDGCLFGFSRDDIARFIRFRSVPYFHCRIYFFVYPSRLIRSFNPLIFCGVSVFTIPINEFYTFEVHFRYYIMTGICFCPITFINDSATSFS